MKRVLALFAGALAIAAAHGAQPEIAGAARSAQTLGRLFFTPTERAQLDTARIQKKPAQPALAAEQAEAPPPSQVVTYSGIVRRSDGRAMLWINNQLVDEKDALSALNVKGKVRSDGSVTIQVPDSTATIELKVGQSVDLHSGKVAETWRLTPEPKASAPDVKSPPQPRQPEREEGRTDAAPASATKPDPASRRPDPAENQRITGAK